MVGTMVMWGSPRGEKFLSGIRKMVHELLTGGDTRLQVVRRRSEVSSPYGSSVRKG